MQFHKNTTLRIVHYIANYKDDYGYVFSIHLLLINMIRVLIILTTIIYSLILIINGSLCFNLQ